MEINRIARPTRRREKLHIAAQVLIQSKTAENGIKAGQIEFTDEGLREINPQLHAGSGRAHLEREIATITRKQARRIAEGKMEKMLVTPEVVANSWRAEFRTEKEVEERSSARRCLGLVWTPVGGDIIFIEATACRRQAVHHDRHLGEVMQDR